MCLLNGFELCYCYCQFFWLIDFPLNGYRTELRYIRDETSKEVDFVVIKDRKPLFAVECKLNDIDISSSLLYFKSKLEIPMWYQVHMGEKNRTISPNFQILSFNEFCRKELIFNDNLRS